MDKTVDPHQVVHILQRAGVPSGAVQSAEDLFRDHHLRARGFIVGVEHPGWGHLEQTNVTTHLSRTPGGIQRPSPSVGQHNEYVLREGLGLSWDEVQALHKSGAVG